MGRMWTGFIYLCIRAIVDLLLWLFCDNSNELYDFREDRVFRDQLSNSLGVTDSGIVDLFKGQYSYTYCPF